MIKTISFSQEEIIKNILDLHNGGKPIELDPTYSKGNFYRKTSIQEPKFKFDIKPVVDGVIQSCATSLPIEDKSIGCIMFDPPFLATSGKSLDSKDKNNIINKRFGVFKNEKDLHFFYQRCMDEFSRILRKDGILIVKCQDKVSSGKNYFSHCFIYEEARRNGLYAKDLFILLAKNRIVAKWQRNQKHARKFHSYFWVFQKKNVRLCI